MLIESEDYMIIQIKNMEDLSNNLKHIPTFAISDINQRITDWIASGGSLEDEYIKQQFRYAENIVRSKVIKHD